MVRDAREAQLNQELVWGTVAARSFASMAQLNIARSRHLPFVFSCCRIVQMCFGFSGALGPTMRPTFQGFFGVRNRSGWLMATSFEVAPPIQR
jgi:hypothetical protein